MRRTPFWAVLAFYPLVVAIVGAFAPESLTVTSSGTGQWAEFLDAYWWFILGVPAVLEALFFLSHALSSRRGLGSGRFIWAAGMLLLGPLVVPAYWWFYSDAS